MIAERPDKDITGLGHDDDDVPERISLSLFRSARFCCLIAATVDTNLHVFVYPSANGKPRVPIPRGFAQMNVDLCVADWYP